MSSTSRGSTSSSNGHHAVTVAVAVNNDDDDDLVADPDDPFDITSTKNAPTESLKRWRVRIYLLTSPT